MEGGSEARAVVENLSLENFLGHCKDFGFYSELNGNGLRSFKHRSDMIELTF